MLFLCFNFRSFPTAFYWLWMHFSSFLLLSSCKSERVSNRRKEVFDSLHGYSYACRQVSSNQPFFGCTRDTNNLLFFFWKMLPSRLILNCKCTLVILVSSTKLFSRRFKSILKCTLMIVKDTYCNYRNCILRSFKSVLGSKAQACVVFLKVQKLEYEKTSSQCYYFLCVTFKTEL